jgi:2-aminoadipate transaminase
LTLRECGATVAVGRVVLMFSERVSRLTSSLVREILASAQRPGMISFAGGLPAPNAFPAFDWPSVPSSAAQYGMSEGEPELREAIATYVTAQGLPCTAEQILVVSGSQQGIDLVAKLFVDPGTPLVTESPTYLAALQAFGFFGARITGLPLTGTGVDSDALARAITEASPRLAYLIPTFQNPSGTCYSSEARRAVAAVLDEAGVPLLEDDPYRELVYGDVDRAPICSHLSRTSWVYQGSFSKAFMPGVRVGYLVASPDLYPHLLRIKQAADLHSNRPGQWLAQSWLCSAGRDDYLAELRERYRSKRDAMNVSLQEHFGDLASWDVPSGGLFFWVRLNDPLDTLPMLARMLERGVAFMPGEAFFPDAEPVHGHMRLNFSNATSEQMTRGLALLAEEIRAQR